MSDVEDDFMCEEEEDYGLVITIISAFLVVLQLYFLIIFELTIESSHRLLIVFREELNPASCISSPFLSYLNIFVTIS